MSNTVQYAAAEPEHEPQKVKKANVHEDAASSVQRVLEELKTVHERIFLYWKEHFLDDASAIVKELKESILQQEIPLAVDNLRALAVQTADIESNCAQLKKQVAEDRFEGRLACLRTGEGPFIPVSDSEFFGNTKLYNDLPHDVFTLIDTEMAVDNFCDELTPFLTQRLAGQAYLPRADALVGGTSGGGGMNNLLPIRVFSPTIGARVSYSPAYFISYIVFSAPTSPAIGMVAPGRYIFMLTMNNSDLFDRGVFDVPLTFDIPLAV